MLTSNSFLALAAAVPAFATALETTAALDLAAGVDGDNAVFGPLATAAAVLRQPTPYAADDAAPRLPKNTDLGALTPNRRQLQECPTECPPGFIVYCDGVSIGPETCGENCCTGTNACHGFTGCVKGDGSCEGTNSCLYSQVRMIENSCMGPSACEGYYYGYGHVAAMKDSCRVAYACKHMGGYGTVGTITKSCNGVEACRGIAFEGVSVGLIEDSCNRNKACFEIAMFQSIKSITKTCNNDVHKPCALLSGYRVGMEFGHLTKFVHAETGKIHTRDSIGSIEDCHDACVNDIDCNGIKWKEQTARPCRFFGGAISDNKCNGRNVCITVE